MDTCDVLGFLFRLQPVPSTSVPPCPPDLYPHLHLVSKVVPAILFASYLAENLSDSGLPEASKKAATLEKRRSRMRYSAPGCLSVTSGPDSWFRKKKRLTSPLSY